MSLTTSLLIGRSALTSSQVGIQVAGDNMANAATPGYHRRVVSLSPIRGTLDANGIYSGLGVGVTSVNRALDAALESRLRDAASNSTAAGVRHDVLTQLETLAGTLDQLGLGSQMREFFSAFSELANNPASAETRALIVEQGASLASSFRALRANLGDLRNQVDNSLRSAVGRANELLADIAGLNKALATGEVGAGENAALRDQRDALLSELSELVDISVAEQPSGEVDVFIGSTPVVFGATNKGLRFDLTSTGPGTEVRIITGEPPEVVTAASGRIGALVEQRNGAVQQATDDLDRLAGALVFEVNRLHSSASAFPGLTESTSTISVGAGETTRALNDPTTESLAALPFAPTSGAVDFVVTDEATGLSQTVRIDIDLDGIDGSGARTFADDTTLQDIVNAINAQVPNLNAEITPGGELRLYSDAGFRFGVAGDTSGVLATLGINTFFQGSNAGDIQVRSDVEADPLRIAAGYEAGSNEAALALARLGDQPSDLLGGVSLDEHWRRTTDGVAVDTASAKSQRLAATQVRESLQAQRDAVSGVSVDEESINLITFQRQFQAAARLISTVDQLTETLIGLV
ncbi:MAG: flagellar hook-associated protein FlgK [Phycisphaerales bacterium]